MWYIILLTIIVFVQLKLRRFLYKLLFLLSLYIITAIPFGICICMEMELIHDTNILSWLLFAMIAISATNLSNRIYPATIYNSLPSYKKMKVNDYYNTIPDDAIIGELNDIKGFDDLESINKYWNIMQKMLLIFTYSKQDAKYIEKLLDENQFGKISTTRKSDLKEHVTKSIDALIYGEHIAKRRNKNILKSLKRNPDIYRYVFNVYCCILTMREKRKNSK